MGIYLLNAGIIFFVGLFLTMQEGQPKRKKLFFLISSILLIAILGFRGKYVGEDTITYIKIANSVEWLSWKEILSQFPRSSYGRIVYADGSYYTETMETGYLILNKIVMQIFHNPLYVQLLVATIICIGFMKFIYDNSENVFLSVWVFLCESLYISSFNGQRQLLAMAISIQAYTYVKNEKYMKACIYILIGALFHASALIYFLLLLISMIKKYKTGIKVSIVAMGVATVSLSAIAQIVSYIFPRYASYFHNSYWRGSVGGTVLVWAIEIFIFIVIYRSEISNYQDYVCLAILPLYLGMEIIGIQLTAIGRVALYFRAFMILLFPGFLKYLKNRELKLVYLFGLMGINFLQYCSAISSATRAYSFFE